MKQLKTFFFGSSDYSIPVLESLKNNFVLTAVVTKSNQPVFDYAQKNNIPVYTPNNKGELLGFKKQLQELKFDLAVVADYGLIIPEEIINIPKYKTINIHFSRLPDLRGASPVQYTILRGDKSAWITYMLMDQGLDTGGILLQKELSADKFNNETMKQWNNITTSELYNYLFEKAADNLTEVIQGYISGEIKPQKQDDSQATHTKILKRDDGYITWENIVDAMNGKNTSFPKNSILSLPLLHGSIASWLIEREVRAFSPWPNVWTKINIKTGEKRLKILKAHLENDKLLLDEVQLEGKKPVSWKQFKEAYNIYL